MGEAFAPESLPPETGVGYDPAMEGRSPPGRIHSFNLLRIIAFLVVAVAHGFLPFLSAVAWRLNFGANGVAIFFVLSGFLITRNLASDRAAGRPISRFFIRRSLRIFPTYFLFLGAYALLQSKLAAASPNPSYWGAPDWTDWCYLRNIRQCFHPSAGPNMTMQVWSLCVEEHFYFIWPWLIYYLTVARMRSVVPIAIAILAAVSVVVFGHFGMDSAPYASSTTQFLPLAIGGLLAYHERWARSAAAIAPAIILLAAASMLYQSPVNMFGAMQLVAGTMIGVGLVLFFLSALEPMVAVPKAMGFLRGKAIETLAMMTYSAYLIHRPIFYVFRVRDSWSRSFAGLAIVLAISLTLYLLGERHWIALGRRLTSEPKSANAPAQLLLIAPQA